MTNFGILMEIQGIDNPFDWSRKAVKKLMEKEQDPFLAGVYDGLQLAFKITANSLYGQFGSPFSPIYFKQIAASTTSTGREMLELARDYNLVALLWGK